MHRPREPAAASRRPSARRARGREREREAKAGSVELGAGGADGAGAPDGGKPVARHEYMPGYHAPHEDARVVETPYAHALPALPRGTAPRAAPPPAAV